MLPEKQFWYVQSAHPSRWELRFHTQTPRPLWFWKPALLPWPCVQYLLTMLVTCRESSHPNIASHRSASSSCSCCCFAANRSRHAAIQKLGLRRAWKVHSLRTSLPGSCTPSVCVFGGPRLVLSLESLFLVTPEDSGHHFPGWLYIPSDAQEIHSLFSCPQSLLLAPLVHSILEIPHHVASSRSSVTIVQWARTSKGHWKKEGTEEKLGWPSTLRKLTFFFLSKIQTETKTMMIPHDTRRGIRARPKLAEGLWKGLRRSNTFK